MHLVGLFFSRDLSFNTKIMVYGFTGVMSFDKNRCINDIFNIHASSTNGYITICSNVTVISDAFDQLISQLTTLWGGDMTYTTLDFYPNSYNGEHFVSYLFEWKNITIDPSTNALGLPTLWELGVDPNDCDENYASLWNISNFTTPDCPTTILCEDCLELSETACKPSYTIVAGLEIGTTYTIGITDRNGKVWKQDVVADGSGDVTVDTTEFPRGFFTPESGPKQLQVWTNTDLTGAELITVGSIEYTCLVLSFQYVTDTTV